MHAPIFKGGNGTRMWIATLTRDVTIGHRSFPKGSTVPMGDDCWLFEPRRAAEWNPSIIYTRSRIRETHKRPKLRVQFDAFIQHYDGRTVPIGIKHDDGTRSIYLCEADPSQWRFDLIERERDICARVIGVA